MIRTCKNLNAHRGAFWVTLALAGTTVSPRAAWGQLNWPGYPNNSAISVTSGGSVGIGTTAPESKLHVEGLAIFHFDDWGNDTIIFRGQKNPSYQWGEYAIRTSYLGLQFRNTQTNGTMLFLHKDGNVGIGTTNPQSKLAVNGTVTAQDLLVTNTGWSDYVFQSGYRLQPLKEVGAYIQAHQHLPGIPSEAEVRDQGVRVGEMQSKLLAKIEELTLHMIQAEDRNDDLERRNQELKEEIREIRDRMARPEPSGPQTKRRGE